MNQLKHKLLAPSSIADSRVHGYSQGVLVTKGKKTLFTAGQLAQDAKGKFVGGSFRQQYKMALAGIDAVLKEAGATRRDVVKITTFLTDMKGDLKEFDKMTKEFFKGTMPASSVVEVRALAFPDQVVEIEAVAVI